MGITVTPIIPPLVNEISAILDDQKYKTKDEKHGALYKLFINLKEGGEEPSNYITALIEVLTSKKYRHALGDILEYQLFYILIAKDYAFQKAKRVSYTKLQELKSRHLKTLSASGFSLSEKLLNDITNKIDSDPQTFAKFTLNPIDAVLQVVNTIADNPRYIDNIFEGVRWQFMTNGAFIFSYEENGIKYEIGISNKELDENDGNDYAKLNETVFPTKDFALAEVNSWRAKYKGQRFVAYYHTFAKHNGKWAEKNIILPTVFSKSTTPKFHAMWDDIKKSTAETADDVQKGLVPIANFLDPIPFTQVTQDGKITGHIPDSPTGWIFEALKIKGLHDVTIGAANRGTGTAENKGISTENKSTENKGTENKVTKPPRPRPRRDPQKGAVRIPDFIAKRLTPQPKPKIEGVPPKYEDINETGGVSVVDKPPGAGKVNKRTTLGTFIHSGVYTKFCQWLETAPGISWMKKNNINKTELALKIPEGNIQREYPVPHPDYPANRKPRIDVLDQTNAKIYEIKPEGLEEQGFIESQGYAEMMNKYEPRQDGKKWTAGETITYDGEKILKLFEKFGYFE